jgi:hypothetical protein
MKLEDNLKNRTKHKFQNMMRAVREDLISSCKEVNLGFDGISPCRGRRGGTEEFEKENGKERGGTSTKAGATSSGR